MRVLTQSFVFDFLSNMQAIQERSYQGKLANIKYQRFTRTRSSQSRQEILAWLLSTARIRQNGDGGNVRYGTLSQVKQTYVNHNFVDGLEVSYNQLTDLDGHGVDIAAEWSGQIGAEIAYFPQREVITLTLGGESNTGYDGKNFFATDHPVNPTLPGSTAYANLFTGAASGAYPGALPIDADTVSVEQALDNLAKLRAYAAQIKMPNGVDPRFLTIDAIIHPPALANRVQQLTNAKFIAQATSGAGGGSGDVEKVIRNFNFGEPIELPEIGAGQSYTLTDPTTGATSTVTGSDSTYYVLMREQAASEIGAMVWINREPVVVTAFTGLDGQNIELAEARKMKWLAQGRGTAGYGLPYFLMKCKQT